MADAAPDMLTTLATRLIPKPRSGAPAKISPIFIEIFATLLIELFKAWRECKEDDTVEESEAEGIIRRAKEGNLRMRIQIGREVKEQEIARGPRNIRREAKRVQTEFANAKPEEVEKLIDELGRR